MGEFYGQVLVIRSATDPVNPTTKLIGQLKMIEKNLGNIERVFRLLAGIGLLAWALSRPELNGIEWFVMLISRFMILNGIFSRCYLWYVLDLNTCEGNDINCRSEPDCG